MILTKYDGYKDSGVEWLGEIPSDWKVKRVKDISKLKSGDSVTSNQFVDEGYPVLGGNGFRGFFTNYNLDGYYVLIGRQGALCGNINYAKNKIWASEHAIVVYPLKKIATFWNGELLRVMNLNQYSLSAAQPGLSIEKISRLKIPVPNYDLQIQISNFLDKKTSQIDKKIGLLQEKKENYKELKKTLINKTVCRGLNKNMELKESGIEWIGKIPKHWKIERLRSFCKISTSSINKKIKKNEKLVKLINYIDVYSNLTKELHNKSDYMSVSANNQQVREKILIKGDVLFTPSSETIEDIGVAAVVMQNLDNTLYSYHLVRARFLKNIINRFKKYLFNNDIVQFYFSKSAKGTTRQILNLNVFNNLLFPLPPKREQIQIANYLDEKTSKIDKIILIINDQIETLKEFKKTLINDVVTGKVRIQDE